MTVHSWKTMQDVWSCAQRRPLAGMIEIRGLGIRRVEVEPVAVVGLVVDLGAADAARLPEKPATTAVIEGVSVPRLAVAAGTAALPLVLAAMRTPSAGD